MSLDSDIKYLVDKLNITEETALELIKFDQPGAVVQKSIDPVSKKVTKKSGIKDEELVQIKDYLNINMKDKVFQNKDISKIIEEEYEIGARQLPSRLKRLVESEFLEDMGGSPKKYRIK